MTSITYTDYVELTVLVQLIREVSLGHVDYLYVYIYSWEFMGSMDKCIGHH